MGGCLESTETGVPGIPEPDVLCTAGSEGRRWRENWKRVLRLGRPVVEVDVRAEAGSVGVGMLSVSSPFLSEASAEELPRSPIAARWPTLAPIGWKDSLEAARSSIVDPKPRRDSEGCPSLLGSLCLSGTDGESAEGRGEVLLDAILVGDSSVWVLGGSGNKGPLFFLRRGNRKNVVVVETV